MKYAFVTTTTIYRRLWGFVKRHWLIASVILLGIVVTTAVEVVVPLFYKSFFDQLTAEVVVEGDIRSALVHTIVIILALHGVSWFMWRVVAFSNNYFQPRVMADIVQACYEYMLGHSYKFYSNSFVGSLVRRVNRLARAFENIADTIIFKMVPLVLIIGGNLIVLYFRHPMIAAALLIWTIVFLVFVGTYSRWKYKYDAEKAELDSKTTGVLADGLTNSLNVKIFTGHEHEVGLYRAVTEKLRKMRTFTWNLSEAVDAGQAALMTLIEFAIFYIAIDLWQKGYLTIGDFALIQAYLIGIFGKLWDFGRVIRSLYEATADAKEMVEILELPHEVQDVRNAKKLRVSQGAIEFKEVFFSFNRTRRIFGGLDLIIEPGQKVALVGPSGAGKSTLTKLLMRLYDVEAGKILIDGQRIDRVTRESLREQLSVVIQEPILFHRTLMENIRYGRRDATDEEVIEAAKKARIHSFIESLPDGYNTYVGERGVKLSGGERQRVAIARAILKDAPIIILDEATSSLDSEVEALIQEALHELMEGKTAIVIAHRLSTIMEMDRILVLEEGKIVEDGTHKSLTRPANEGRYKDLWERQVGGYLQ